MSELREKFYKEFPRHAGKLELEEAGSIDYFEALGAKHDFVVYQAGYAQAMREVSEIEPVAWIEHHKSGDNLNWDEWNHLNAPATPLIPRPKGTDHE